VKECVTHHYACDCREEALASEIARLRDLLEMQTEARISLKAERKSLRAEVDRLQHELDEARYEVARSRKDESMPKDWPGELSDRVHRDVGNARPANAELDRLRRELDKARSATTARGKADAARAADGADRMTTPDERTQLRNDLHDALVELSDLRGEVQRLRAVVDAARQIRQWPGDCEYMEALSAALDALDESEAGGEHGEVPRIYLDEEGNGRRGMWVFVDSEGEVNCNDEEEALDMLRASGCPIRHENGIQDGPAFSNDHGPEEAEE
jgi:DNA repair exonuclease SbcCD ATPase subunit